MSRCYLILLVYILPDRKSLEQGLTVLFSRGEITEPFPFGLLSKVAAKHMDVFHGINIV